MRVALILVGLLIGGVMWAQQTPAGVADRITLVVSSDAPGFITRDRLAHVYWQLIQGQKLEGERLPKIMVMHVSRKVAANAGVVTSAVNIDNTGHYQLWLVGEPSADIYVRGLETVLRHEFGLEPPQPEVKSLLERVIQFESSTVDVRALASR